jgi:hypothetical protein
VSKVNLDAISLKLVLEDTATSLHVMPDTVLSADSMVDIAKNVLAKVPCKWGECKFVLNSWNMVQEV